MSGLRRIWKITVFALSPIPKLQEWMQAILLLAALLGIVVTPEQIFGRLSLDFSIRLALLFGLLFVLFFFAALRLEHQLNLRPITLEFDRFQSTIRIRSYKKTDHQDFDDFKVYVKLLFRPINNDLQQGYIRRMNMMFIEKRFLQRFRIIAESFSDSLGLGHHLLTQYADKKYVSFLDGIPVPAKSPGSYYWMERNFEIESLGLLLVNKDRYFFRLTMTAGGQSEVVVDIKPDWDGALIEPGNLEDALKDTVREFRFRD
jgi:hypothetical protein